MLALHDYVAYAAMRHFFPQYTATTLHSFAACHINKITKTIPTIATTATQQIHSNIPVKTKQLLNEFADVLESTTKSEANKKCKPQRNKYNKRV